MSFTLDQYLSNRSGHFTRSLKYWLNHAHKTNVYPRKTKCRVAHTTPNIVAKTFLLFMKRKSWISHIFGIVSQNLFGHIRQRIFRCEFHSHSTSGNFSIICWAIIFLTKYEPIVSHILGYTIVKLVRI